MMDIVIKGAKENNLKNIDLKIPKNKFIVMTGLSGSGKTSLAFDTIYKEGQRRYVESLSAYARQFLGNLEKPNVESIEGLSPAISIDQKTTSKNPRSTVGTVTEIYDYFRLLYARIGKPMCPTHGIEISSQSIEEMTDKVLEHEEGTRIEILAPVIEGKKGTHQKTIEQLRKDGFVRIRINGDIIDVEETIELEKNKKHSIEVVIDRLKLREGIRSRLYDSLETASKLGEGKVTVLINGKAHTFSEHFACPHCDFSIGELEPRLFSFNAPFGACNKCSGLGYTKKIDTELLVANPNLSAYEGAIKGWTNTTTYHFKQLVSTANHYNIDLKKSFKDLTDEEQAIIFYGSDERIEFKFKGKSSNIKHEKFDYYEGIVNNLERRYIETTSRFMREWIETLMAEKECPVCRGKKLNEAALSVKVGGLDIIDLTDYSVKEMLHFFDSLSLNKTDQQISHMILKEINERLAFLKNVGLDYLTLSRQAATLSGGESQRIRLATQIGSRLTGVLYVLDEPSIGLHQRDNARLIGTLKSMRDLGNTLIVVEHDEETMAACDQIIDIGPGAGEYGGEVIFQGTYDEILNHPTSITGKYLSGRLKIDVPEKRRKPRNGAVEVIGAYENNLKKINVKFPRGVLTVVTGVSGSGKSSLVNECLYKGLYNKVYKKKHTQGKYETILGADDIEKIINIDQSPIGRTPRSNPGTYTGVFDDIRDIFAMTNEAKMRGYLKGRFSFNVKGGRCETCHGDGLIKIEMHFLPDIYVPCEACKGKRYNKETLQVTYKGKNIADVLDMTIEEAVKFFENIPKAKHKLETLVNVGLGYLKIGQPAPTLSGGEAQRVKLAKELHKRITADTIYILDEPTTGLHSDDVKRLLKVIDHIVEIGATVVIIEHNLDVIKVADHIIDLGPEGGDLGGEILIEGTPEAVAKCDRSYTGQYLKHVLGKET
ncbi:excinuclease ABC subunit UvrA [Liberiplasma polymorphum]|uniref:excinuclease ABC subunit UvrA n=1 Tax=Liberiplasma polymorphum TaxID=3374570 RepID=UPI003774ABA0